MIVFPFNITLLKGKMEPQLCCRFHWLLLAADYFFFSFFRTGAAAFLPLANLTSADGRESSSSKAGRIISLALLSGPVRTLIPILPPAISLRAVITGLVGSKLSIYGREPSATCLARLAAALTNKNLFFALLNKLSILIIAFIFSAADSTLSLTTI